MTTILFDEEKSDASYKTIISYVVAHGKACHALG